MSERPYTVSERPDDEGDYSVLDPDGDRVGGSPSQDGASAMAEVMCDAYYAGQQARVWQALSVGATLLSALHGYLEDQHLTADNCAQIRMRLYLPFESPWNGIVDEMTKEMLAQDLTAVAKPRLRRRRPDATT